MTLSNYLFFTTQCKAALDFRGKLAIRFGVQWMFNCTLG
jgi:uncharacterized glyoxalase superfamily protein PhnB